MYNKIKHKPPCDTYNYISLICWSTIVSHQILVIPKVRYAYVAYNIWSLKNWKNYIYVFLYHSNSNQMSTQLCIYVHNVVNVEGHWYNYFCIFLLISILFVYMSVHLVHQSMLTSITMCNSFWNCDRFLHYSLKR